MGELLQHLAKDFSKLKDWITQNSKRRPDCDWDSDSSLYTCYDLNGFRFTVSTDKKDRIDDHIQAVKLEQDEDIEVALFYNLKAPGTQAKKEIEIQDKQGFKELAVQVEHDLLSKALRSKNTPKAQPTTRPRLKI